MTRIEAARRKVGIARIAIVAGATAALAVFAGLARASHPATRHASTRTSATRVAADESAYFGGTYSIGPSGSAQPQIQSGAS